MYVLHNVHPGSSVVTDEALSNTFVLTHAQFASESPSALRSLDARRTLQLTLPSRWPLFESRVVSSSCIYSTIQVATGTGWLLMWPEWWYCFTCLMHCLVHWCTCSIEGCSRESTPLIKLFSSQVCTLRLSSNRKVKLSLSHRLCFRLRFFHRHRA